MSGLTRLCLFLFPVSFLIGSQLPPALAQGVSNVPSAIDSPRSIVRPRLKNGSAGVPVSELQGALKLLGYYNGDVDGNFGESTELAVFRFQRAAGLNPDGIVGRATWQRLFPLNPPQPSSNSNSNSSTISAASSANVISKNDSAPNATQAAADLTLEKLPVLKIGMRGPEVFWLQQRLQTTGLFQGNIDGIFGSDTLAAVKAAQERYGLKTDGIVGNTTWRAILP